MSDALHDDTALDDTPDTPRPLARRLTYATSWALLVLGAVLVPMPIFAVSPGGAIEVVDLVVVNDHATTPLDGSAALLAVQLTRPSVVEWLRAEVDPTRDLVGLSRVVPSGQRDREYFDDQAVLFADTFEVASVVALRALGLPVQVESSPRIVGVLPNGPAAEQLLAGDIVRTINDVAVATADDLVTQARRLRNGDEVRLELEREGKAMTVQFTAGQTPRMERPGLGVTVDTAPRGVQLPIDVRLADDVHIGGPSAGLLFTITVYDLLAEENLLAGRRITGTGTMDVDGRVGRIGSVRQKVTTAIRDGYEIFLTPRSQAEEARTVADGRILVIGVDTFDEALAALRAAPRAG